MQIETAAHHERDKHFAFFSLQFSIFNHLQRVNRPCRSVFRQRGNGSLQQPVADRVDLRSATVGNNCNADSVFGRETDPCAAISAAAVFLQDATGAGHFCSYARQSVEFGWQTIGCEPQTTVWRR